MKSKFIVEVETKNMKTVVPEEYINCPETCPEDEVMTDISEKELHETIFNFVNLLSDEDSKVYDLLNQHVSEDEMCPEGTESLEDFGSVTITVTKARIPKIPGRGRRK